jgi:beta-aspartyl-peptidase (threonine type)
MPIAIVVHGGAGNIEPELEESYREGCKEAAIIGWRILQAGGSALEAVEAAVRALEDNPCYNAGTGACLTSAGNIELDAGIMEGHTLQVGAVAGVELIKNPITLARSVLKSPHVLLIGKGAQQFALEQGFTLTNLADLITERQYHNWKKVQHMQQKTEPGQRHGTVGAVALDSSGKLAAATSTGGMHNKHPGRVGDSPLVGAGFYADEQAAVSCTGDGEDFTRLLIAKRAADEVARGASAQEAAEAAIAVLNARSAGRGGLILVDHTGNVGIAKNSRNMAQAYLYGDMSEPEAGV